MEISDFYDDDSTQSVSHFFDHGVSGTGFESMSRASN